jgi:hypothetical protein
MWGQIGSGKLQTNIVIANVFKDFGEINVCTANVFHNEI